MKGALKELLEKKRVLSTQLSEARQLLRQIEHRLKESSPLATDEQGTPLTKEQIILAVDRITDRLVRDETEHQILLFPMDGALPYASLIRESLEKKGADIPWLTLKMTSYTGVHSGQLTMDDLSKKVNFIDAVVYVADDVMDTGKTSLALRQKLMEKGAKEVRFIPLVDKYRAERGVQAFQYGFRVSSDAFIIGFGLDYLGYCRNFGDIRVAALDLLPDVYENLTITSMEQWQKEWMNIDKILIRVREESVVSIQRAFRTKHGFFTTTDSPLSPTSQNVCGLG